MGATYAAWKNYMKSKGLRPNFEKTNMMITDVDQGPTFTSGKHPCGASCKVVDFNSIVCNDCAPWVHKRFNGMSSSLDNMVNFKCRTCLNSPVTSDKDKKNELDNVDYEVFDQFCW